MLWSEVRPLAELELVKITSDSATRRAGSTTIGVLTQQLFTNINKTYTNIKNKNYVKDRREWLHSTQNMLPEESAFHLTITLLKFSFSPDNRNHVWFRLERTPGGEPSPTSQIKQLPRTISRCPTRRENPQPLWTICATASLAEKKCFPSLTGNLLCLSLYSLPLVLPPVTTEESWLCLLCTLPLDIFINWLGAPWAFSSPDWTVPDVSAFPPRQGASGPQLSLWPLPGLGAHL